MAEGRESPLSAPDSLTERMRWVAAIASDELRHATEKFPPFNSPHEGLAVIWEEFEELKEHVWGNTGASVDAAMEAIQIAAMALRYVHDIGVTWGPRGASSPARATTTDAERPSPESASDSSELVSLRARVAELEGLLSQITAPETHPGRDTDQEEPCATRTVAARGSEDTPSTPATARADATSSATEAPTTSTARADEPTESPATGTSGSAAKSGVADSEADLRARVAAADRERIKWMDWHREDVGVLSARVATLEAALREICDLPVRGTHFTPPYSQQAYEIARAALVLVEEPREAT